MFTSVALWGPEAELRIMSTKTFFKISCPVGDIYTVQLVCSSHLLTSVCFVRLLLLQDFLLVN